MAIRPIHLLGDPVLRSESDPISNPRSAAVRVVADDLQETFRDLRARYGIGRSLAAPQIGAPMRIIYVEIDEPWFLLNPSITDIGIEDFLVWDDCFSIPDLLVRVQRSYQIQVNYQDMQGDKHTIDARGPLAELLQHEIDHLDGILSVDHPTGIDPFCVRTEWKKLYTSSDRYSIPELRRAAPDFFVPLPLTQSWE